MPSPDLFVEVTRNNIPEALQQVQQVVDDAVQAVVREGERYMKAGMRETEKGSDGHSQPGNFPAVDTSALINSINVKQKSDGIWDLRWGTEYAIILEFGTALIYRRVMLPRPMGLLTKTHLLQEGSNIVRQFLQIDI